jgi:hypothetical protein
VRERVFIDVRTSTDATSTATISSAIAHSAAAIDATTISIPTTAIDAATIDSAAISIDATAPIVRNAVAVVHDAPAESRAEVPAATASVADLNEIVILDRL